VVLLRLSGLSQQRKAEIAIEVFAARAADFEGRFSVITETGVKTARVERIGAASRGQVLGNPRARWRHN
jgi:hypothetical protein